ncbi:hypothetical protein SLEP1_g43379 [Rubroshorea leprosula]|uniref:Ubiquitin carboxyl-terminal hydrolase 7 ICP0-binding domain-containing protein n=1 Tax=Rubroshorea leprosula TaxID=152421 RepID=A0AAV5LCS4_9ROSI|nr:hypothetical protein SLEP1_g43379 [Rubroshorea leprosula]
MMMTEQEEKQHQKEEYLCTTIKVARDEDLGEQIGRDIYFDLVDHEKVRSFRVQKQTPFNVFKEEVSKVLGIPVQFQRFWLWAKRQNHTYRPDRPLTKLEETKSVGMLREFSQPVQNAELKLFLEVELGLHLRPIVPPDKTGIDILLFFKHYDPEKEELRYVGRLFVKRTGKPTEILSRLNEMAGYDPDEEIDLYEEIKFEPTVMCAPIDKIYTFGTSELGDGDIICFQKSLPVESAEQFRYPDVPSFLDSVHNRAVVHFRALEKPKEDEFCVEMSMLDTYENVVEKVAQQLGLDDPSKIRLTAHNCYSQLPKPRPIKYHGVNSLSDMLVHFDKSSDILYYEVLDIPLPELQYFKTPTVASHHAIKDEERLKKEHEGKELKKKTVEAQLCTIIKVARDEDLGEQIGRDIYFDLVDFDKVQNFRFEKQTPFNVFKEEVAKVFRIPVQFQRFWLLAKRENNTYRPKLPLTHLDETRPLGTLVEVSNKAQNVELKLFLEVERGLEIQFEPTVMCESIDKKITFGASQLGDGDIICFQKSLPVESAEKFLYPDVPSFLEYLRNRQVVHFRSLENPKEDDFCLEMRRFQKCLEYLCNFNVSGRWNAKEDFKASSKCRTEIVPGSRAWTVLTSIVFQHFRPIVPPDKTREDILLFFKHYDPEKEELRYVGRLFVKLTGKPIEILSRLNEMAGYDPDEEIDLYEEIKFEPIVMCEPIDKKSMFETSQLGDGDIICFQKSLPVESAEQFPYPDVPSFLESVHNRSVVHFRSLEKPKEDDFCVEMSMLDSYDNIVEKVAQQLGLDDPSKIRLTAHNCYSQLPKPRPIKYRGVNSLSDMLVHFDKSSDILYYEVLDIPLPELQNFKTPKVASHHAIKDEVSMMMISNTLQPSFVHRGKAP